MRLDDQRAEGQPPSKQGQFLPGTVGTQEKVPEEEGKTEALSPFQLSQR